jgi:hypothetical protein
MSLATICVNVANDVGIAEPVAPIYNSASPTAKRLVAQARRALRSLLWRAAWSSLVIEYEFTASGASDYPLPPDYLKIINDTVWERSRYWAMRGALSPQQWQRYRSSIYGRATIWRRWRIRVPSGEGAGSPAMFSIDPMVAGTDHTSQFVFEYQSAWPVKKASDGTMAPGWTADDDTTIISDYLVELGTRWRMLRRLGLAYDEEKEEYDREVDKAVARDGGMMTLQLVPFYREDFIGQYSLGAFPPSPPAPMAALPPDIGRIVAPMERPDWQPPADLSLPPPLVPRPPLPAPPSEAERAQALLARAPPAPAPRPPVRRLRRRHQVARPRPAGTPLAGVAAARPPAPGIAHPPPPPAPGIAPPAEAQPLTHEAWEALESRAPAGAPLLPRRPEPQLPPGT